MASNKQVDLRKVEKFDRSKCYPGENVETLYQKIKERRLILENFVRTLKSKIIDGHLT